jgi:hypothetical protein
MAPSSKSTASERSRLSSAKEGPSKPNATLQSPRQANSLQVNELNEACTFFCTTPETDLEKAWEADQSKSIVVMPSNFFFNHEKTLANIFRVPVSLPHHRPDIVPFPNLWTMFVYDGSHKAEGAQLWRRLVDQCKLTRSSTRDTQWCSLNATALLNRSDGVQAICRVLFRSQRQIDSISESPGYLTTCFMKL